MKKLTAILVFACSCSCAPSGPEQGADRLGSGSRHQSSRIKTFIVSNQDILDNMQASYFDTWSIWGKDRITVCFIDPKPEHATYRKMVRKAVQQGWDDYIKPDFIWTDMPCEGQEDVRIQVADERPYAVFGVWKRIHLPWVPNVTLNFEFNKWGKACKESKAKHRRCIMKHAAHEFGHSLGFVHEQNRPDTPNSCHKLLSESDFDGLKGNYMSKTWDAYSVMNYCSYSLEPSDEDIATAVKFYGAEDEDS